jgi:ferredoxin
LKVLRKILKYLNYMGQIMAAKVDNDKCTGCGTCEDGCPVDAIKVNDKAKIDEEECIDCGTCVDECPEEAISLD